MKKVENAKTKKEVVRIPPIELKTARITLVGVTPLLVHRKSEKMEKYLAERDQNAPKNKPAPRSPHQEYLDSMYKIPGKKNVYGIPASGVKLCAVSACRFIGGIKMTTALGAFHVVGDIGGLIPIEGGKPTMDERIVQIGKFGSKTPQLRYRGRWDKWHLNVTIRYNSAVISPEQLVHLYENAGFGVGLCEHRPEKKGNLGMFSVKRG